MQNVYESVSALDRRVCEKFELSAQILVENAANAMLELIKQKAHKKSVVTIICGSGDNGADGYALARKLSGSYRVRIYQAKEPKTPLCVEMHQKARLVEEIRFISKLTPCDVVVDCLFGSGLKGRVDSSLNEIIVQSNLIARLNIACDVPSGLLGESEITPKEAQLFETTDCVNDTQAIFKAHYTMCMGALKSTLLSDEAKDYVGEIIVAELGISRQNYEIASSLKLLETSDMCLPTRENQNAHKGSFGHLCVFMGNKSGAGALSAQAGFAFGAGLVSVVDKRSLDRGELPLELMKVRAIPQNVSAYALGMGLGEFSPKVLNELAQRSEPCVIDADALHCKEILEVLEYKSLLDSTSREIVLTPHPKEFSALLEICGFGRVGALKWQDKMRLAMEFSAKFPHTTLLLKGATTIIAKNQKLFFNTLGSVALAKGGSGDVLAGMIGALLAQGYDGLKATISASLAHALAGDLESCTYALTPQKIIANLAKLETLHL
ncbi:NAD(P)H-hydrate dehydratase [Helicobacter himalayensis]|uniref:NAD(P)H-hydrate dehydratase n=1 Tax=Helicobacter himalayensis TaxID=1591088 RepID=UPI003D6DEA35